MYKYLILLAFFVAGLAQADTLEEADAAYSQGDLDTAKLKYEAALAYDQREARAYLGIGQVLYDQGDYEAAEDMVDKGMRYDRDPTVKLDLKTLAIKVDNAMDNKRGTRYHYRNARRISGYEEHAEVHLAMARVYMDERDFDEARTMLEMSLKSRSPSNVEAEQLLSGLQTIERALAITDSKLAFASSINKGQIAKLLVTDLQIANKLGADLESGSVGEKSDQGLTDYQDSAYRESILAAHRLGLRSFRIRNGAFSPDKAVTRADLAFLIEDVLHAKFDVSRTRFIGTDSPFADLPSNHTAFNAMMTSVTRGLLQGNQDGKIQPDELVSGAEAILVLHELDGILNQQS